MTRQHFIHALVVAFATLAAPSAGSAHEYWLRPSIWRAARGELVRISAWNGVGFSGERKLYAASRTESFRLTAGRDLDLTRAATDADTIFARFVAPDDSGAVVSFVSAFTRIELAADRFDAYLVEEGLEGPRASRAALGAKAGPGHERYRRCARTLISGRSGRRFARPLDLPMEIVPLADPAGSGAFKVRVTFIGQPLAGALVKAWRAPLGSDPAARPPVSPVFSGRTDTRGELNVTISGEGEWLLSAVHMVPSAAPDADWESTWASLTFARLK